MVQALSRRDFLKLGGLALGSLAFRPFFPRGSDQDDGDLARVTIHEIDLHGEGNDRSEIVGKRSRDQLVHIYYEVEDTEGPQFYNRLWYRVWGGYLHSAYLQRVQIDFNEPLSEIPEKGQLCEVTVPFTQSYSYSRYDGWRYEYRLYYQTTHWATGVDQGPDGEPWYRITDELQPVDYYVPAIHMRPIPAQEIAPISPDVPATDKRIEISLASQILWAFEKEQQVYEARISSGIQRSTPPENAVETETPKGRFNIYSKMPSKHMGDGNLMRGDLDLDAYELVGVPWTSFFAEGGYAMHGTYWHNNFGWPMSHGCVNMRNEDAKWIFRWSTPVNAEPVVEKTGYGTRVHVY
ncbi:MAG TPA: L,D-transpeptidase family protein [Anaerolineales bacterium]|jgi:lipoprotein-anchoring transpeptidase ErfK/SrfK|nr:L,D-transpeptidase family protein [Anaerolineales bacterium]